MKTNSTKLIKPSVFVLILGSFLAIISFYFLKNFENKDIRSIINKKDINENHLIINDSKISVEVADSPIEITKGLSNRGGLATNSGMLFVFEYKKTPSFWMKEMKFPIDIIWIDDDQIVDISKNVPEPDSDTKTTQLPLYKPVKPVNFVLEVNANYTIENNINIGDRVIFNLSN